MTRRTSIRRYIVLGLGLTGLHAAAVRADAPIVVTSPPPISFVDRATITIQDAIDHALDLLDIRYRRGGNTPESGFDCSGFVGHVFRESLGLVLPHNAKAMSEAGTKISPDELKPGDLVFFNTMRKAFSHVGIYLGHNQFVHSPSAGGLVRIENMHDSYWKKRFNGARRIEIQ